MGRKWAGASCLCFLVWDRLALGKAAKQGRMGGGGGSWGHMPRTLAEGLATVLGEDTFKENNILQLRKTIRRQIVKYAF